MTSNTTTTARPVTILNDNDGKELPLSYPEVTDHIIEGTGRNTLTVGTVYSVVVDGQHLPHHAYLSDATTRNGDILYTFERR